MNFFKSKNILINMTQILCTIKNKNVTTFKFSKKTYMNKSPLDKAQRIDFVLQIFTNVVADTKRYMLVQNNV